MKHPQSILFAIALCFLPTSCDRKAPEPPPPAPPPANTASEAVVEPAKTIMEPPAPEETPPPPVVIAETEAEPAAKAPPMPPESVPGLYRDPAASDVLYDLEEGDRWTATWQTPDGRRGLMMEGMYQIEGGGVVHLLVTQLGRRGAASIGDWDLRAPPQPRPRAYFRIEGNELVLMPEKTGQAFTMPPFTASRLMKVAD